MKSYLNLKHVFTKLILITCLLVIKGVSASALSQIGTFYSSDKFSSGIINYICQDKDGYIWIATDYGLNKFDGYRFVTFLHEDKDSTSLDYNAVVSLYCDKDGQLWVGTNHGLDRYDREGNTFIHYTFPEGQHPRVSSILQRKDGTLVFGTAGYGAFTLDTGTTLKVYSLKQDDHYFHNLYEDTRGRLWRSGFEETISMRDGQKLKNFRSEMGSPTGFTELDGELLIICQHGILAFRNETMGKANIDMSIMANKNFLFTSTAKDADGNIYIGTRGQGIYRISSTRPHRLEQVTFDAYGIVHNTIKASATMFDRQGNLWIGCNQKGLVMIPQQPAQFSNWSFDAQGYFLGSTISSVCEGDGGIIWCTVQGVGVYGFNKNGRIVAHPSAPDAVEFIFRDRLKRYWLGTDDGLFSYDPITGRSEQKVEFECDKFNDMTSDSEGNIYISTYSRGFCVYNPQTGALRNYNFYDENPKLGRLCNNWIMGMSSDRQGLIWMATSSGVSCYDPKTGSFRSQGWEVLLDGMACTDLCELNSGQLADGTKLSGHIAIGTEQGLYLYNRTTHKVERFPNSEQLNNKCVGYIVQSNNGDIWCSTSQGIWQYDIQEKTFIDHVNGNGLTKSEYLNNVGMHTDDDQIFFAHNDGLTVFSPTSVKKNQQSLSPLQLVAFFVGNQTVNKNTVINGVQITDRFVTESNYFTLSYLDHTITLAFSQLNYDNPTNMTYQYRVNQGQWVINPKGKNSFTLGHLQPGSYRIEVRAQVGNDYTPVKVIIVTVRAPWYRTLTAYFIYLLLLIALIAYLFYLYRRRANRELNEEKMKFLINATHDIRSPLTLIMAPLEKMKKLLDNTTAPDGSPAGEAEPSSLKLPEMKSSVETIERNAKRILHLVNQILDVRKIDKQQMQLLCQSTDLVAFTGGVCKMFEYYAKEHDIEFSFHHEGLEQLYAWIDIGQFDKVITNLLSNAFKYSKDGSSIEVRLSQETGKTENGMARLQVIDNGIGLDTDSLKHVFDRFYQGNRTRQLHVDGTGIGLNLCKMIVDMHHGNITAQNRSDGKRGAVFTVELPLGNSHLKPEEMEKPMADQEENTEVIRTSTPSRGGRGGFRVLVVDDDQEIGRYISTELSHYYKFTICPNGKEGLKELLANEYDIVISDVMMPEMDGFTMLRMIKTNLNLSHLPVIMLTSKADVGNRLEGLERGADAFLAKPFDMDELHLTIENLIQTRQRLKGKFTGAQQQADKVEQVEVKGNDEQLMERIMKSINKNLSDSDFNVEMLTQEVGISRAQLHRKMKELTGISTSEFIRNIRLEQAARLLKEQKINVTQVAYTVGFSNLAHFSTIFRKHFGVAPSEYAERKE